jgi:hypothetical protein
MMVIFIGISAIMAKASFCMALFIMNILMANKHINQDAPYVAPVM